MGCRGVGCGVRGVGFVTTGWVLELLSSNHGEGFMVRVTCEIGDNLAGKWLLAAHHTASELLERAFEGLGLEFMVWVQCV